MAQPAASAAAPLVAEVMVVIDAFPEDDLDLADVAEVLLLNDGAGVPVLDRNTGAFAGMIYRDDLVRALVRTTEQTTQPAKPPPEPASVRAPVDLICAELEALAAERRRKRRWRR